MLRDRLRDFQRHLAGQRGRPGWRQSALRQDISGRSARHASGGTAIAPGVPNSAVDATVAANQTFTSGFPQGQLSCASPQANPATLSSAGGDHGRARRQTPRAVLHGVEPGHRTSIRNYGQPASAVRRHARGEPAVLTQVNGYQTVCQGCFAPFPYLQPTDPRFGAVTQFSTGANSHYNGLQLTAMKRLGHGLQGQVNYTWSRCMDTVSNGGFLQFSAGGILSPLPGDWPATMVLATTTSGTISTRNMSISCRSKCGVMLWATRSTAGRFPEPRFGTAGFRSRF